MYNSAVLRLFRAFHFPLMDRGSSQPIGTHGGPMILVSILVGRVQYAIRNVMKPSVVSLSHHDYLGSSVYTTNLLDSSMIRASPILSH